MEILDILNKVRPEVDFSSSEDFITDGFLDSLDIIKLVSELDQCCEISISGVDIIPENFVSVDAIKTMVLKYQEQTTN